MDLTSRAGAVVADAVHGGLAGRRGPLDQVRQFERLLHFTDRHIRFWEAVGDVPGLPDRADIDPERMRERAEHQQRRLLPLWRAATGSAFPGDRNEVDTTVADDAGGGQGGPGPSAHAPN